MNVEIHIMGITTDDELRVLQERLQRLDGVELHAAERTRLEMTYDESVIAASDLQDVIEAVGGEVVTMNPAPEEAR